MPKSIPKFGAKEEIKYVGVKDLTAEQQQLVNELATHYYPKIKRAVHNLTSVTLHIKTYQEEGSKVKYSVNITVTAPSNARAESSRTADWDLARALHKSFKDVVVQVRKIFKADTSYKKSYG